MPRPCQRVVGHVREGAHQARLRLSGGTALVVRRIQGQGGRAGLIWLERQPSHNGTAEWPPYILRRLLLMIPTLLGIMLVSFVVIQFAPGGPVEQVIRPSGPGQRRGRIGARRRWRRRGGAKRRHVGLSRGAGARPRVHQRLEEQFGFDMPAYQRFGEMIWNYARFDFGTSFFSNATVVDLILQKLPVSISHSASGTRSFPTRSRSRSASARRCTRARASTPGRARSSSSPMPFRASSSPCFSSCSLRAVRSSTGSRCGA